jgi:hypothetical protein
MSTPTSCHICKNQSVYKCSNCKKVEYCSKECQRADWDEHKYNCEERLNGYYRNYISYSKVAKYLKQAITTTKCDNIFSIGSGTGDVEFKVQKYFEKCFDTTIDIKCVDPGRYKKFIKEPEFKTADDID